MTMGEKIQSLRKKNNWSQETLAEKLMVSRQAVSLWERDESQPELDKLLTLSKLFGVSTDYLIDDDLEEPISTVSAAFDSRVSSEQSPASDFTAASIFTTVLALAGLLTSAFLWYQFQNALSILLGLFMQFGSVFIFTMIYTTQNIDSKQAYLHRWLCKNLWFLLPIPILIAVRFGFSLLPFPFPYNAPVVLALILYLIICTLAVHFLKKSDIR